MSDADLDRERPASLDGLDREGLAWRFRSIVGEEDVRTDEPMSAHTTFEIGGPADFYVTPEDIDELREVVELCRDRELPLAVIGRGSDLLVADEGYRGVVIGLSDGLTGVDADGERLVCEAGVPLREAAEMACELGLSGFEFACGIPGSIGGASFMNAGAYDGCMADVLESVRVITPEGELQTIDASALELGYRTSLIRTAGLIAVSATLRLHPGDPEQIRATMEDLNARRAEKQPLDLPSAGSTFKRPEGFFAGKLISDAGLKGYQVGGAAVSEKHAGFVVNLGGATAADVRAVIAHVQGEVERQFGVRLEPEVRFLG